jgi:TetR/AcrR family acrAB operon transcriptional repressor
MPRKTKEEAEKTRQLLLDTALTLFAERGISATSLKEIAAAAGLTHGALYWHFKNRTDLVAELYESSRLPLDDLFLDQLQSARQDALASLGDFMVQWSQRVLTEDRPAKIWKVFHQGVTHTPELQAISAEIQEEHREWLSLLAKMVKKARKQKQIAPKTTKHDDPIPAAALGVVMGATTSVLNMSSDLVKSKRQIKCLTHHFLYGLGS